MDDKELYTRLSSVEEALRVNRDQASTNRTVLLAIAASVLAASGWFFMSISSHTAELSHSKAQMDSVNNKIMSHHDHPQLHSNGITALRRELQSQNEKLRQEYQRLMERSESGSNKDLEASVNQLNRRIELLESLIQEILEGYIESANGKELPNTGHDQ